MTYPRVNVDDGWQYAHSFSDPEDQWSAEPPPQLERLLSGQGAITAGLATPTASLASSSSNSQKWVRRRRWVRVMRRRLDIPPLPFLQPDGQLYQLSGDGGLVPVEDDSASDTYGSDDGGHELGAMPASFLSVSQDYVARSRYLAGTPGPEPMTNGDTESAVDARRGIAKLERAVMELRTGLLGQNAFSFCLL